MFLCSSLFFVYFCIIHIITRYIVAIHPITKTIQIRRREGKLCFLELHLCVKNIIRFHINVCTKCIVDPATRSWRAALFTSPKRRPLSLKMHCAFPARPAFTAAQFHAWKLLIAASLSAIQQLISGKTSFCC